MKKLMTMAFGLGLLAGGLVVASDNVTLSLGTTLSDNHRWAVKLLAIDGQPVERAAVVSHQRVFVLKPGRHTLRLARWNMGTGTRLAGTAQQTRVIHELDVTMAAGGRYRVEGTGRGSDWSPHLVSH